MEEQDIYKASIKLLLSLVIGILFGIERDMKRLSSKVPEAEGKQFGGIRTFALIGLLGGLLGYLGGLIDHPIYIYGFIAVATFLVVSYVIEHQKGGSLGMTTEFSALMTYTLGTLCVLGPLKIVIAFSIIALLLLSQKKTIGTWSTKIKSVELLASLKFALVLFVIFPFLKGIEPVRWHDIIIIDPFRVWKMVVLICSVSYVGYFLARMLGEEKGVFLSGALGGLASSTAVTHAMSVKSHEIKHKENVLMLAGTTLLANSASFLRVFVILAVLNYRFALTAALPIGVMTLITLLPGLYLIWAPHALHGHRPKTEVILESPFSLKPALFFGMLYAVVIFLVQFAKVGAGDAGVYLLSLISGFPDVDAISVTLANLADTKLTYYAASFALVLGLGSNLIFKSLIARAGGKLFCRWVASVLAVTFVCGLIVAGVILYFS